MCSSPRSFSNSFTAKAPLLFAPFLSPTKSSRSSFLGRPFPSSSSHSFSTRGKAAALMSKEHCFYCFDTLVAHFDGTPVLQPTFEDSPYPLFVTWSTAENSQAELILRGCIGNFGAMPLHSGLKEYALTSAFHDGRFPPIAKSELSSLVCGVSLLVEFEDGANYLDWEVGVHGVWIEFKDNNGRKKTATYLPEVAKEQGWTKQKAIDSLLRKGGYRGTITQEFLDAVILTRYQSKKAKATYQEYLETR